MKIDLRKYRKAALFVVMFVFIHSLRYFDYVDLNPTIYGWISNIISLLLLAFVFVFRKKSKLRISEKYVLGLLLVPMLSFLPAYLENGQSPVDSLRAYLVMFLVLVYFVLHYAGVEEKSLVRCITAVAIVRILILVIQQFTYPYYLFSFRPEGFNAMGQMQAMEIRSGLYRFYIEDTYLSMFLIFYYFQKLSQKGGLINLVLFMLGIVGVYLDQSRQFMLSTAVSFILVFLFSSKIKKTGLIAFLVLSFSIFAYFYAPVLMKELSDMTSNDMSSDNIRLLTYATFLFEYWGGPLSFIFGNGMAWGGSAYGQELSYMMETMRMYRADVGIVGALNQFGIITVAFYVFFYFAFVFRNWKKLPMHLKMYFLASIINLPLVTIYTQNINWFVFLAMMLYLSDRSIVRYDIRQLYNAEKNTCKDIRKTVSA